jgi:hypothetical protein
MTVLLGLPAFQVDELVAKASKTVSEPFWIKDITLLADCLIDKGSILACDLSKRPHMITRVELPEVLFAEKVLCKRFHRKQTLQSCVEETKIVRIV